LNDIPAVLLFAGNVGLGGEIAPAVAQLAAGGCRTGNLDFHAPEGAVTRDIRRIISDSVLASEFGCDFSDYLRQISGCAGEECLSARFFRYLLESVTSFFGD
jgi:hypothetical protein